MDENRMSVAAQDIIAQAQQLLGKACALAEEGELAEALKRLTQAHELDIESAEVTAELARLDRQLKLLERLKRSAVVGQMKWVSDSLVEALDAFREILQAAQDVDSGLTDEVRAQLAALLPLETRLHQEDTWSRADELVTALWQARTENRILANHVLPWVRAWFELATSRARARFVVGLLANGDFLPAYGMAVKMIRDNPYDRRAVELAVQARIELQKNLMNSVQDILHRASALKDRGELESALSQLNLREVPMLQRLQEEHPEVLSHLDPFDALIQRVRYLRLEILAEIALRLGLLLEKAAVAGSAVGDPLLDACVDDAKLISEQLFDLRRFRETSREDRIRR